jgi:uncharacterized protein (DUF1501 family)
MKRRDFLQLCGATAGAYAIGARAGTPPPRTPRRLVCVFVTGGWDTTYALDPKDPAYANIPAGRVQTFDGLDIFVDESRPNVTAFFERYAGATALVRGVSTDAINHNECQRRIATGTREETRPDFGAIVAHDLGNDRPVPYLILGDTAWTGPYAVSAGRIGGTNQIVTLVDDGGPTAGERAILNAYAEASAARTRAIRGSAGYNKRRLDDYVEAMHRGDRLRAMRDRLGPRGDALAYTAQVQLAVDALQRDLAQAVMISTRLFWDTHADNYLQGAQHDTTFAGLTQLVDGLAAANLLDTTVVAVISEMSRTPMFSGSAADPHIGKGHWPVTSAFVVGGGVRAGVYGATDAYSGAVPIELSTGAPDLNGTRLLYSHFVAGLLTLCGVDPGAHLEVPALDAFVG